MKYVIVGHDVQEDQMRMLHGIYHNRKDADAACVRSRHSEITPARYRYDVVEVHEKEMQLFRAYPADTRIQAMANVADATLTVFTSGKEPQEVRFTNVPMEHVLAAMSTLNGDNVDADAVQHNGHNTPAPRTEDFTRSELFKDSAEHDYIAIPCEECGALIMVAFTERHMTWHNKLLP